LHPNNLLLVFESNRPTGSHLYAMTRASETDVWGPARDLAELYGTTNQDGGISPMFSTDGSQLYYVHYIAIGSGPAVAPFLGGDMFGANAPADLPYPDVDWTMSDDELELFWSDSTAGPMQLRHARRPNKSASWVSDTEVDSLNSPTIPRGWPGFDDARQELYYEDDESTGTVIAVAKRASPTATFDAPTMLTQLGSDAGDPEISFDGKTLVFSSTRAGGGGANDLYFVTRQCQ
jgi:Tol biopolymer transport system component